MRSAAEFYLLFINVLALNSISRGIFVNTQVNFPFAFALANRHLSFRWCGTTRFADWREEEPAWENIQYRHGTQGGWRSAAMSIGG
jgi:hypothetical protein